MQQFINKLLDNFIHAYVKNRLKQIADEALTIDINELIKYHDYMAIQCVNCETKAQERVLGISVRTACALEGLVND